MNAFMDLGLREAVLQLAIETLRQGLISAEVGKGIFPNPKDALKTAEALPHGAEPNCRELRSNQLSRDRQRCRCAMAWCRCGWLPLGPITPNQKLPSP